MNVGDTVRILPGNDYDDGAIDLYGLFAGLTGEIVGTGYEVPVPEGTVPLYHVQVDTENSWIQEDNPWPFYETEVELDAGT